MLDPFRSGATVLDDMHTHSELRIEPPAEILDATRNWLAPVRAALGPDFKAA